MKKILMSLLVALFLVGCNTTKSIKIEQEVGLLKPYKKEVMLFVELMQVYQDFLLKMTQETGVV